MLTASPSSHPIGTSDPFPRVTVRTTIVHPPQRQRVSRCAFVISDVHGLQARGGYEPTGFSQRGAWDTPHMACRGSVLGVESRRGTSPRARSTFETGPFRHRRPGRHVHGIGTTVSTNVLGLACRPEGVSRQGAGRRRRGSWSWLHLVKRLTAGAGHLFPTFPTSHTRRAAVVGTQACHIARHSTVASCPTDSWARRGCDMVEEGPRTS